MLHSIEEGIDECERYKYRVAREGKDIDLKFYCNTAMDGSRYITSIGLQFYARRFHQMRFVRVLYWKEKY